jgi:spore coat protein U-like protein
MENGLRPLTVCLVVAFLATPMSVAAKTATNTMTARLQVDASCRLTTEPLTFGNVNIFTAQVDATARIQLRCGPAVAYSVAIDNGLNFNGQRRMFNGVGGWFAYVPYEIYRNAARSQVWGATLATMVTGTTPANGQVTLTAYGRVPSTIVLPRDYVDTVTVTVNF